MIITFTVHGNSPELAESVAEYVKQWITSNPMDSDKHHAVGVMQIDDYFEPGKPLIKGCEINGIYHDPASNLAK